MSVTLDEKIASCGVLSWSLTGRTELAFLFEVLYRAEEPIRASIYSCEEVSRDLEELH